MGKRRKQHKRRQRREEKRHELAAELVGVREDRRLIEEFCATVEGCVLPDEYVAAAVRLGGLRRFDMFTLGVGDLRRMVQGLRRLL